MEVWRETANEESVLELDWLVESHGLEWMWKLVHHMLLERMERHLTSVHVQKYPSVVKWLFAPRPLNGSHLSCCGLASQERLYTLDKHKLWNVTDQERCCMCYNESGNNEYLFSLARFLKPGLGYGWGTWFVEPTLWFLGIFYMASVTADAWWFYNRGFVLELIYTAFLG